MYGAAHFHLNNQAAVVTGAGAGMGRAIAETFAAAGAAVMVGDRNADAAHAVGREIGQRGGKDAAMACNATEEEDLARLVQATARRFGKLAILVGNAGNLFFSLLNLTFGQGKRRPLSLTADQGSQPFTRKRGQEQTNEMPSSTVFFPSGT